MSSVTLLLSQAFTRVTMTFIQFQTTSHGCVHILPIRLIKCHIDTTLVTQWNYRVKIVISLLILLLSRHTILWTISVATGWPMIFTSTSTTFNTTGITARHRVVVESTDIATFMRFRHRAMQAYSLLGILHHGFLFSVRRVDIRHVKLISTA